MEAESKDKAVCGANHPGGFVRGCPPDYVVR